MNIPTANVFIAYDKEVMERLFYAGATYQNLVKELTEGTLDGLLFDTVANPNFISFEHTHGMGSNFKMTLSFIDPKKEFERRFIGVSQLEAFAGMLDPESQTTKSNVSASKDEVKNSQSNYKGGDLNNYKNFLKQSQGNRKMYIAYGVGDNLDLWSGPHVVLLLNASIDFKGSRQITIDLVPTPKYLDSNKNRGAYGEKIKENTQGLQSSLIGESQEIKFTQDVSYDPTEYLDSPQQTRVIDQYSNEAQLALANQGYRDLGGKLKKYDFHTMVVDAIRSYVQKATNNKNVVVVLPNLNISCAQSINDKGRETGAIKGSRGGNAFARRSGATRANNQFARNRRPGVRTSNRPFERDRGGLSGGSGGGSAGGSEGSYAKAAVSVWEDTKQADLGREENFVAETLGSFGISLKSLLNDPVAAITPKNFGMAGYVQSVNSSKNSKEAFDSFYKQNSFYGVIEDVEYGNTNPKETLKTVFDSISRMSHESYKPSSFCYGLVETNSTILKNWGNTSSGGRWGKSYTLAGYDDFDENSPAIIVGDTALIKEYLYGSADLNQKTENIRKLRSAANRVRDNKEASTQFGGFSSEELESAASSEIPLHPMDRVFLANKEYNKLIKDLMSLVGATGAFGGISDLPDNFSYRDVEFTDTEKLYIAAERIPVFRYNTTNPNVLDMKFKYGAVYYQGLMTGFKKLVNRLDSASVGLGVYLPEDVGSFPVRSREDSVSYVKSNQFSQVFGTKSRQDTLNSLANRVSPDLGKAALRPSPEKVSDFVAALLQEMKGNLNSNLLVDQAMPGTPHSIMTDLAEDLYKKANRMDIQTLPMFHLSQASDVINSHCLVFAQDQEIKQSRKVINNPMSQFHSGIYHIIGFKHTITKTNMSSSFSLVKARTSIE